MEKDSFRRCSHPRKGVSGARGAVSCRWRGLLPRHDALLHFCARISTRLFYRKSRYGYRHVRFDVQMSIGLGDWIRSLGRSYPLWSYSSLCFFARAPSPPGGGDEGQDGRVALSHEGGRPRCSHFGRPIRIRIRSRAPPLRLSWARKSSELIWGEWIIGNFAV